MRWCSQPKRVTLPTLSAVCRADVPTRPQWSIQELGFRCITVQSVHTCSEYALMRLARSAEPVTLLRHGCGAAACSKHTPAPPQVISVQLLLRLKDAGMDSISSAEHATAYTCRCNTTCIRAHYNLCSFLSAKCAACDCLSRICPHDDRAYLLWYVAGWPGTGLAVCRVSSTIQQFSRRAATTTRHPWPARRTPP